MNNLKPGLCVCAPWGRRRWRTRHGLGQLGWR